MVQVFCLTRTAKLKFDFPLFFSKRDFRYAMAGVFLFGDSFGLKVMIFECKYTAYWATNGSCVQNRRPYFPRF